MFRKTALVVIFASFLCYSHVVLAHGDHDKADHEEMEIFETLLSLLDRAMAPSVNSISASSDVIKFSYGTSYFPIRRSAFSAIVEQALRLQSHEAEKVCAQCDQTDVIEPTRKNWTKLAQMKTVQISAWAYRSTLRYGIGYGIFAALMEASEVATLGLTTPFCPPLHALYVTTATARERFFGILGANEAGVSLSERTRAAFLSVKLDVIFWWKLKKMFIDERQKIMSRSDYKKLMKSKESLESVLASSDFWGENWNVFNDGQEDGQKSEDVQSNLHSLVGDIDFIFDPAGDPVEKYWISKRHVQGFGLYSSLFKDLATGQYSEGKLSTADFLKAQGFIGQFERTLSNYQNLLGIYALSENTDQAALRKEMILAQLQNLTDIVKGTESFLESAQPRAVLEDLNLMLTKTKDSFQKMRKGSCSLLFWTEPH